MIPILVRKVTEIVEGKLITGLGDREILGARRNIESLDKQNMLTFIYGDEEPDWHQIKKYSPCTIVTSQFFKEYKSLSDCDIILVSNVKEAYWAFVNYYRDLFNIPIIAITGTSGKTTTKEMIYHILSSSLKIIATVENLNNSRRSLRYLLRIDHTTEAAVFETAVGKPGDVGHACKHYKPTIGIITNIGTYHLDTCKTVENYIKEKAEMIPCINENGVLILNSDDENTKKINFQDFKGRIVYFGLKNKAHFEASNIKYSNHRMKFLLTFQGVEYPVNVQGYGEYQVYNALAAITAVHELGIGIKQAAELLASYENLPLHLEMRKGIHDSLIIDDTWNYNLTGLTAGLKALVNHIAKGKKTVVMLGGLGKLGYHYTEITSSVGNLIADLEIDHLIIIGDTAEAVAYAVKKRGGTTKINICKDSTSIYNLLKELLDENTVTFVKCYRNEYSKPILDSLEKIIVK